MWSGALVVRCAADDDAALSLFGVPQASRHVVRNMRDGPAVHFSLAWRHRKDQQLAVVGKGTAQLLLGVWFQGGAGGARFATRIHAGGHARRRARHPPADALLRRLET